MIKTIKVILIILLFGIVAGCSSPFKEVKTDSTTISNKAKELAETCGLDAETIQKDYIDKNIPFGCISPEASIETPTTNTENDNIDGSSDYYEACRSNEYSNEYNQAKRIITEQARSNGYSQEAIDKLFFTRSCIRIKEDGEIWGAGVRGYLIELKYIQQGLDR